MGRNELRVGRLEARAGAYNNVPVIRVIAEAGESSDDCIRRHGHEPDDFGKRYIVRSIIELDPRTAQLCRGDHA